MTGRNAAALRRAYLRRELKEYISKRAVTPEELADLKLCVQQGYSVYDNPWGVCGEDGWPLDYLEADRFMRDIYEQESTKGI